MKTSQNNKQSTLNYQLKTFRFAWNGIYSFFRSEYKSRLHLIAALMAVTLGLLLPLTPLEWVVICLSIASVFTAEIINSAIEIIVDRLMPRIDADAGTAKDMGAAAVLIISLGALISGLIIFIPKILSLL